ncbi:MAG: carbohydrate binding family 9 domain-containing protein [Gemmatimonadetes bacterium]|nr:carbohydrate binding family 9 domain-containing protein [Gemmatimonadota bacterium]
MRLKIRPPTAPLLALALTLPSTARAQARKDTTTDTRPVVVAVRRAGPIDIDGHLDEAAWKAAEPATGFIQQTPDEGAPATQRTDVRFLYDDQALYIGARMYDSAAPAGVTARLARRDDDPQSDELQIDFDPYHDRLHHVAFDVDPAGWRGDSNDGDSSWDPVWEVKTSVDSLGWTAEIRIPFSQLHFSSDSVQTWGLEIMRLVHRSQEHDLWAFYHRDETGGPSFYGTLSGLRMSHAPLHAEVLPYVVARTERLGTANPASPFYDPHPTDFRVGGDLDYLLGRSFALSATVNPDFGQVEVDPAVVNLTAFETYFPEKRPFFVQGSSIFDFGSPGCMVDCGRGLDLFYSRRIGAPPPGASLAYAAGAYASVPDNTTILGAAKVTGRTSGGTTVGLLDAVTNREVARVAESDGTRLTQPVAPLTNDFVGRVKQDLDRGDLVLGGLFTSADRRLHDPGLAGLLPAAARTGGVDGEYFWGHHAYHLYAALTASHVAGDSAAILRLQRSSARYYQRPDRTAHGDGLFSTTYDPHARSLDGYGAIARVAKGGGSWIGDLNGAAVSPGFETNDLGFQQKADWLWLNGSFGRRLTTPTRWYRTLMAVGGAEGYWNYDGDRTRSDVTGALVLQLLDYWSGTFIYQRLGPALDDRLTRGGPVVAKAGETLGQVEISTDPRRSLILDATLGAGRSDDGGYMDKVSLSATVRPSPNVSVSLTPTYARNVSTAQYVTSVADPTATAFYGERYVFAHLDEKQLSMETRVNVTFTPALSLELYAQPLLASGAYSDLEQFARPRSQAKLVYGRDVGTIRTTGTGENRSYVIDPDGAGPAKSFTVPDPNFDLRSLRGTAVLRWEWRPGSTAYLVWTQTRSASAPLGDLAFGRDMRALGREPSDNVFEMKVSYWLGQ